MPTRQPIEDGWDDEFDADDHLDANDDESTIPCPYCGREIHEDAQRCPFCEQYISAEDAPVQRKRWWIVIGAGLGLYAVYRWTVG